MIISASIEKYLQSITGRCKQCGGSGYLEVETEDGLYLDDCMCVRKVANYIKLIESNIPKQYWDFGIRDINAKFIKKNKSSMGIVEDYVASIEQNMADGNSLWLCSAPGLGKSTIICSILKLAIDAGKLSYWLKASHAISMKFDALSDRAVSDLIDRIVYDVDILAIEELEKIYLAGEESMNNNLFYEFLSDVYDSKKPLLISSNKLKKDVLPRFPTFIQDRIGRIPEVIFVGMSERK